MSDSAPHLPFARQAAELMAAGDSVRAIAALKQAIRSNPRYYRGWLDLARLLYREKQYAPALQVSQAAEQFDPLGTEFLTIQRAMQSGDLTPAERTANAMLKAEPGHPRAIFTLAQLAQGRGDHEKRVEILKDGLDHCPANLLLRQMLIGALEDAGSFRQAIAAARHLVEIEESFASLHSLMGVLFRYGLNEEALAACDRAERHCSGDSSRQSEVDLMRGQVFRIMGERERSEQAFRASIASKPHSAAGWLGLADMKNYRFSDADRDALRALMSATHLDRETRSMAAFAMARAEDIDGDPRAGFALYEQANALHATGSFSPERFSRSVEDMIAHLDADALASRAVGLPFESRPVFIIGMPRSGSTLVEQILTSHSQVEGTIEHLVLPAVKRAVHATCLRAHGGAYLDRLGQVTAADLARHGQGYLDETTLFRRERCRFFTDKLPYNFEHVGLIHKILPEAVIIDVRRNPMDCGLSLYRQHFAAGAEYSYDLGHTGAYYNGYLKLMDHWDAVLPGRVFRVQYEALVREPEAVIRAMLDHVGLEFEPACLDFHENSRAVRTASSEQVRRPMYTDSIGLWRQVEEQLQPLRDSLGEQTLARFADLLS
ncbi:tetratricopeptide repeat-containing sulfotransferase family protein [Aquisalinus flavus]|uniref:Sulfotransferase n=1 Tax=Aquisalinus flavus TaxID=1526572 RepID=A0A8J2Y6T7_9PROT|nr:sulfotransferase [Aquisalinus flavus]MBD0426498.1 sulfotransferase [Aquisalinus flavus]UNE47950.1 tetratricopeptide repeat protein [Aquisalinus flavus]GGD07487.1 hypothetical protein GCM10011342_15360 [Aquisalinus flavus]